MRQKVLAQRGHQKLLNCLYINIIAYLKKSFKKVKDLLIDEKVPLNKRNSLLMIEKDKQIINIFGVKKSQTLLDMKNNITIN